MVRKIIAAAVFVLALTTTPLFAQAPAASGAPPPAPPPKPWSGNVSFGLSLTNGNKDTTNFNLGFEAKYDPKTKNVFKTSGLFLYGKTGDELSAEQYGLTLRDEYSFNPRAFVFGDLRYLHDHFKGISYLYSPSAGIGYKVIDVPTTALSVSVGAGGVWEKDIGFDVQASGALTFDEKFTHKLTKTATAGQAFSGLWKTSDMGDALYAFGVNLAASITSQAQLKVEMLDTYKAKPPDPKMKSNDIALVMGVVYKF